MQPVFKRASPWLLGMLLSTPAWAVSVGDMRALSALGEPLRMELELVDLEGTRVSDIKLTPASAADYARLGLIAPVGNDALSFSLANAGGHVLAQLNSAQAQSDPHVSLLIQISWPGAVRLQQVAAVLLPPSAKPAADAPVAPALAASDAAPAPAEAATGATLTPDAPLAEAATDRKAEPSAAALTAPLQDVAPLSAAVVSTVPASGKRVVVVAGDSLGSLAAAWNAPRLHVAQRQQLIAETNPQIFTGGNINRLRVGSALTLPSADTEPVPSLDDAVAWLKAHEDGQRLAQPAAVAASAAPAAAAAGDSEVTLTLVSPAAAAAPATGAPAAAGEGDGLSEEMAAAESTRDDLEAERAALQARLEALKTQTEDQDARLKLLDERLAALNGQHKDAVEAPAKQGSGIGSWLGIGFALVVLVFWMLRRSAIQAEAEQASIAARTSATAQDLVEFEESQALAAVQVAGLQPGGSSSADEYDFLTDSEAESFQTRLDLAQAYLDMGETQAAQELLRVVQQGGTSVQRQRAGELLGVTG